MTDTFAKPYSKMPDTSAEPERLKQLEYHIQSGDYFPLLSTIMCFLEEGMRECETGAPLQFAPVEADILKNLREDLLYLHKNYALTPKAV